MGSLYKDIAYHRISRPLHKTINATVDDEQGIKVQDVSLAHLVPRSVLNSLILLLEVGSKCGSIATTI
jgi:hypothetical protein